MRKTTRSSLAAFALLLGATPVFTAAPAEVAMLTLPERASIAPVLECAALARRDFAGDSEAPASISGAKLVPATQARAEFCVVRGYVAPQVQFELHLPTRGYTGRYLQGGCGGNCGSIPGGVTPRCDNAMAFAGAFALGFTDSGHAGANPGDTVWARGSEQLRVDFAYRATHVVALAAKRIITAFYGVAPQRAYFQGCSNGGREGLNEAQRFPGDFDGIIAGSPGLAIAEGMMRFVWEGKVGLDAQGKELITPAAASLLHESVLRSCDKLDGISDGQIDDARACRFDPQTLLCKRATTGDDCLTAAQVLAARKLYQGPMDGDGQFLYPGGRPYGSELQWPGTATGRRAMAEGWVGDLAFAGAPPEDMRYDGWRFDRASLEKLRTAGGMYDSANPDLSGFRARGGKLLLWEGGADPSAGSYVTLDYYQAVRERAGGLAATREFARLFRFPGVYHCGAGYVPYEANLLGALVQWVEEGKAPDRLLASARLADGSVRNRPLFPYPDVTLFTVSDKSAAALNDAANFTRRAAKNEPQDGFDWPATQARGINKTLGARF